MSRSFPLCCIHMSTAKSSRIFDAFSVHLFMHPPPPIVFIGVFPILSIPPVGSSLSRGAILLCIEIILFSLLFSPPLCLESIVIGFATLLSIFQDHNLVDPSLITSVNFSKLADDINSNNILICLQLSPDRALLYSKSLQSHIHLPIPLDQNIRWIGFFDDD